MISNTLNTKTLGTALRQGGALTAGYDKIWSTIWQHQTHVPVALLELCRLRLAQFHDAKSELALRYAPGLDAGKIESLLRGDYVKDARFSAAELAALDFTEIYAQDPMAISDEQAASVKQHLGEAGLVCLIESLGFIEGRIRLALMFSALQATPKH
ncbi:hypothetical protein [Denitratisoma oestradiolicum]|uniref:Uncharacterized protein n=1 Tax=Denitratisoma oestradiolicum TaxID=311182 RepID=A0A6S6XYI1_9PROT|nr:hypothetical protein [Denitratisoma oestradiolicum]TWO80079.1 hypothetical protein CBW56_10925 [Denitratisoma oestradiolicum]CAB1370088.1 conserved protein of unknown function [Denitratisoma oestradiolicum]